LGKLFTKKHEHLTTKVSFGLKGQNETAVALPASPSAGEPGVIEAFFWLYRKNGTGGESANRICANEWNKPAAYIGN